MKISLKWLNDFVDVNEYFQNPQALADILTKAGLEVEDIQNKAQDLKNVIVGHIQIKDKHPNADKLSLCQVITAVDSAGQAKEIQQIVCGAQNHKTGDKVVVALPGAILPGNFAIKKSKIRDVESNGMLCSLKELGLATESEGIQILSADAPVGELYAKYMGLDDIIFELKVTPNRADCLSHYGLAREIGCLLNKPVKQLEIQTKFIEKSTQKEIKLSVEDRELCLRYSGRYIENVKIQESPAWLKNRLESIGLNSINNVVDVTNYVMLEMGQPLHAFDADLIAQKTIVVRKAKPQEKFTTLKEQEIQLSGDELMICDGEKPVALAGVIGGLNSGVSQTTQNLFIESANFKAMSVRKSSRFHGVETDSAYRFSRGVDPSQTQAVLDRAVYLISLVAGGEAYSEPYDIYPTPVVKKAITIKTQTISDRLGYQAESALFERYMLGLQCQVERIAADAFKITPPLFRFDLENEMDLVEEYARLKGYEFITETLPSLNIEPTAHDSRYTSNYNLGMKLRALGFDQAFNYAFLSDKEENKLLGADVQVYNKLGLNVSAEPIKLLNPLNEDLNIMRRTLSFHLLKNMRENFHAGNTSGQLYEIGSTFHRTTQDEVNVYHETRKLGLVMWGEEFGLFAQSHKPLVYKLKLAIEKLIQSQQISAYTFAQPAANVITEAPAFLHTGQWAQIVVEGKAVGYLGALHPVLLNEEKIRVPVCVAEINLDLLIPQQVRPVKFKSISSLQTVERDFAFVMNAETSLADLFKEVKKVSGSLFQSVQAFDVYQGDKLPVGQKSVAVRVVWQPQDQALTEAQISELSQKVLTAAEKSVGAKLR